MNFIVFFDGFLDHALLCPMDDVPISNQMKGLMEVHNRGKFHWRSICGCEVINFQMFSKQQKIPFLGAFG